MSAAPIEWPSLDKILAQTAPVDPVAFDLAGLLDAVDGGELPPEYAETRIGHRIARLVDQRNSACDVAASLESELAELTDRIKEALGYLTDALVWTNDTNTADCISEAISALGGAE